MPPEAAEGIAGVHRPSSGNRWDGRLPRHRKYRLQLAWPQQTPTRGRWDSLRENLGVSNIETTTYETRSVQSFDGGRNCVSFG